MAAHRLRRVGRRLYWSSCVAAVVVSGAVVWAELVVPAGADSALPDGKASVVAGAAAVPRCEEDDPCWSWRMNGDHCRPGWCALGWWFGRVDVPTGAVTVLAG